MYTVYDIEFGFCCCTCFSSMAFLDSRAWFSCWLADPVNDFVLKVLGKIVSVAIKYHFRMPPYFTLLLRSLASFEGRFLKYLVTLRYYNPFVCICMCKTCIFFLFSVYSSLSSPFPFTLYLSLLKMWWKYPSYSNPTDQETLALFCFLFYFSKLRGYFCYDTIEGGGCTIFTFKNSTVVVSFS